MEWNRSGRLRHSIVLIVKKSELFKNITCFKVGEYSPWVSDHSPLLFEMISSKTLKETEKEKLDELPKSFQFSLENRQKFIETLKSPKMREKLTSLTSSENADPQGLLTKITDLLIETCDKAGIKPKKQKHKYKTSEPWFDEECENIKKSIKKMCRRLRINQKDEALRKNILMDNKL